MLHHYIYSAGIFHCSNDLIIALTTIQQANWSVPHRVIKQGKWVRRGDIIKQRKWMCYQQILISFVFVVLNSNSWKKLKH